VDELVKQLEELSKSMKSPANAAAALSAVSGLKQFNQTIVDAATGTGDLTENLSKLRAEMGILGDAAEAYFVLGAQAAVTGDNIETLANKMGLFGKTAELVAGPTARLFQNQVELAASFNKTTGAAGKYNLELQQAVARNLLFDTTGMKTAEATERLFNTFTDFTVGGITPAEQALVDVAVALEAVAGVSDEKTAKSFQLLRTGLGQTDGVMADTVLGLEAFAEELGVSADTIFTDFNNAMPTLAMFGSQAEQVFKQTAAAAKATGVEMKTFQSVFDLTDTFEGSAGAVGQLNALLGGPFLNTVELTMAETPVERMQMLSQAFEDAGMSVDDMSRRQMQAFMGTKLFGEDATQFAAILRGEFDLLSETTGATGKGLEGLEGKLMTTLTPDEITTAVQESTLALDMMSDKVNQVTQAAGVQMLASFREVRKEVAEQLNPVMERLTGMTTGAASNLSIITNPEAARQAGLDQLAGQSREPTQTVNINLLLDGELVDQRTMNVIGKIDGIN
jgi:hypothetical protein